MDSNKLNQEIRDAFQKVYSTLGFGFDKKIYEEALMLEFDNRNISYLNHIPVNVYYDGVTIGRCEPDFLVHNEFILLLTVHNFINEEDTRRLDSYCDTTCCEHGLLLNFGVNPEVIFRSRNHEECGNFCIPVNECMAPAQIIQG